MSSSPKLPSIKPNEALLQFAQLLTCTTKAALRIVVLGFCSLAAQLQRDILGPFNWSVGWENKISVCIVAAVVNVTLCSGSGVLCLHSRTRDRFVAILYSNPLRFRYHWYSSGHMCIFEPVFS